MKTSLLRGGMAVFSFAVCYGQVANRPPSTAPPRPLLNQYCTGCHNDKLKSGNMTLTQLDLSHPDRNPELAEKVIRKLRAGMMPPAGMPRPTPAATKIFL